MNTIKEIEYCQLNDRSILTDSQLMDIAGLIYDTDQYISDALFASKAEALRLIPEMIKQKDAMFNLNHFFVAMDENRIVGLVLWCKGSLNWTTEGYDVATKKLGIEKTKYFSKVEEEYFSSYNNEDRQVVSLIDICVCNEKRNKGIGDEMLAAFFSQGFCGSEYELHVLADNLPAISLYRKHGFQIIERLQGFSVDDIDLPCYRMKKCL